jgi:hypothetical protein
MPYLDRHAFARGFFRGLGRALDLRGAVAAPYPRPHAATPLSDHDAVARDWEAVWGDLDAAFTRVRRRTGAANAR